MIVFEFFTFKTANFSIATNESYKEIAIKRGKMDSNNIQVVRSGPKLERLKILGPVQKYKKGKKYLVGYVGVIGEQEGIDLLLDCISIIVKERSDIQFAIVGGGTDLKKLMKLSESKGLSDYVDFYGRVSDEILLEVLNTSDVCVNPDKPTVMNNLSTMNKIMEYMAIKKPIIQFDLKEGRYSAQGASLYADDVYDFSKKIMYLMDNQEIRIKMGNLGYQRVVNELSWEFESKKLLSIYNKMFS